MARGQGLLDQGDRPCQWISALPFHEGIPLGWPLAISNLRALRPQVGERRRQAKPAGQRFAGAGVAPARGGRRGSVAKAGLPDDHQPTGCLLAPNPLDDAVFTFSARPLLDYPASCSHPINAATFLTLLTRHRSGALDCARGQSEGTAQDIRARASKSRRIEVERRAIGLRLRFSNGHRPTS